MANAFGRKKMIAFEPVEVDKKVWEVRRSNPEYWRFDGVRKTDAIYAPSYPKIEEAYSDAGVEIYRPENEEVIEDNPEPQTLADQESQVEPEAHWRELNAAEMKDLAAQFTDEPVKNKAEATAVLEQAESEGKL